MAVSSSFSNDGRELVSVIFQRESPEADTPIIEIVYEVIRTEGSGLSAQTVVVINTLSVTTTDTRVPIFISQEEKNAAAEAAAAHLANQIEEKGW